MRDFAYVFTTSIFNIATHIYLMYLIIFVFLLLLDFINLKFYVQTHWFVVVCIVSWSFSQRYIWLLKLDYEFHTKVKKLAQKNSLKYMSKL